MPTSSALAAHARRPAVVSLERAAAILGRSAWHRRSLLIFRMKVGSATVAAGSARRWKVTRRTGRPPAPMRESVGSPVENSTRTARVIYSSREPFLPAPHDPPALSLVVPTYNERERL